MKKLTAALLLITTPPLTAHAMRTDLQKHFAVSYALAMGGDVFCGDVIGIQEPYERAFCAFGSSFAVGFAKEVWDHTKPNNHFDSKDLMFDIAGAATGAATSKILRDWKVSVYNSTKTDEVGLMARYDF